MSFNHAQPYIVVGAFIVRDGKILIIQENHEPDKGKWNIPAGKLDFSEDPQKAAQREAFEEAGIRFTPTAILGIHSVVRHNSQRQVHVLRVVYTGDSAGDVSLEHGEAVGGVPEIAAYKWVTPEELLSMDDDTIRYHDLKKLVHNYQTGKRYPLDTIAHFSQAS